MFFLIMFVCFVIAYYAINAVYAHQGVLIDHQKLDPGFWSLTWYQVKMLPIFFVCNILIGLGFKTGMSALSSMTWVSVIAVFSNVVSVLLVAYWFYGEIPNVKVLIGVGLVLAGVIVISFSK